MDETRIPGRPSFPPTRIGAPRKVSKKKFQIQDKLHQEREDRVVEALSTAGPAPVPPRYFCDFKQIRIRTATFWRWRSLAQELGLEGDEQMASYLLNMYYEYVRKAASEEEKRDIPQNSKEARQRIETSLLQDDQKGIETDDIESTILPTQGTQDGSIGLHQGKYPSDSMKERSKDGWRGDGDGTDDGGKKVLEGEFTCLVKAEPDQSDEEFNQHGTLASCSQQEDDWTGGDDDNGQKIVGREFTCLIKEEPDDSDRESNQPSCSQQGGDLRQQSSYHMEQTLKISGDTSHDRSHEEHLPQDFPIQAVLGNHFDLSTGGDCSSEYDSYLLPRQADYSQGQNVTDDDPIINDHEEAIMDMNTHTTEERGEKCEADFSKNLDDGTGSTRSIGNNAEGKLFICSVCSRGFKWRQALYRHMKLHSGEKPHECTICKKRFLQSIDLEKHLRIHSEGKPYSCSLCEKRYCERCNLIAHMSVHSRENHHPCAFCDKIFVSRSELDAHVKTHAGEKLYRCTDCNLRFCRFSSLKSHIKAHSGEKPFKCTFCNKAFTQAYLMRSHSRIHTGEKPFECSVCGERFSFNTQLADHEAKHTGVKPYLCPVCGKGFWRKHCLKRHAQTHIRKTERRKTEHRKNHAGEKHYQCTDCSMKFSRFSWLQIHRRTHKEEETSFKCTYCSKAFATYALLKVHKRTHTDGKPYECSECGERFSFNTQRVDHENKHRGVKPHLCAICQKGFWRKHGLKRHMKTHRGKKGVVL